LAETGWQRQQPTGAAGGTLQPFVAVVATPQAVLDGPELELSAVATQPLTMLFHELATNATKYGALSSPDGVLRVTWSVQGNTFAPPAGRRLAPPRCGDTDAEGLRFAHGGRDGARAVGRNSQLAWAGHRVAR
jgi:hypothetical protein